jgi:hypothetical protein
MEQTCFIIYVPPFLREGTILVSKIDLDLDLDLHFPYVLSEKLDD